MQAEKGGAEGAALPLARLLTWFQKLCNVLPEASRQVIQAPSSDTYLLASQIHSCCKVWYKCLAMTKTCTATV